jgi:hypothetical protein
MEWRESNFCTQRPKAAEREVGMLHAACTTVQRLDRVETRRRKSWFANAKPRLGSSLLRQV